VAGTTANTMAIGLWCWNYYASAAAADTTSASYAPANSAGVTCGTITAGTGTSIIDCEIYTRAATGDALWCVKCYTAANVVAATYLTCAARTGYSADAAHAACWVAASTSTCNIWAPGWAKSGTNIWWDLTADTVLAVDPSAPAGGSTTNANMIATGILIAFVAFLGFN
jgi:hypothetical protein